MAQVGRPTKFDKGMVKQAIKYIESFDKVDLEADEIIPTIAGLAKHLKVAKSTLYEWTKDGKNPEFSNALEMLSDNQEIKLFNNGLKGVYNSAITKLGLANHGYSDKIEQSNSGSEAIAAALMRMADSLPD